AFVGGFFLWQARIEDPRTGSVFRRARLFALGVVPGCLIVMAINANWYGSPFAFGYGRFSDSFRIEHVWPNLRLYPRWLIESQTPLVLLGAVGPFLLPRRAGRRALALTYLAFAVAVYACYAFYVPYDAWWYLRYLLPAFPPLMVLTAVAIVAIAVR